MDKTDLKPCPFSFCKYKHSYMWEEEESCIPDFWVRCPICGAAGPKRRTFTGARNAWNAAKR